MRISCPNCLTEYDVPDAVLGRRSRGMRCAHCGHQWQYGAAAEAEAMPVAPSQSGALPLAPAESTNWAPLPVETLPKFPPPVEERVFGRPVDEAARAEIASAALHETVTAPAEDMEANTIRGLPLSGGLPPVAPPLAGNDSFAALVDAARSKSIEYEPEPPPPVPAVKISSKLLVAVLVILLIIAVAFLARPQIMHVWPASRKLFHAFGAA